MRFGCNPQTFFLPKHAETWYLVHSKSPTILARSFWNVSVKLCMGFGCNPQMACHFVRSLNEVNLTLCVLWTQALLQYNTVSRIFFLKIAGFFFLTKAWRCAWDLDVILLSPFCRLNLVLFLSPPPRKGRETHCFTKCVRLSVWLPVTKPSPL